MLCRVSTITQSGTAMVSYTYMGWEDKVVSAYGPPQIALTYLQQSGEAISDGGDPYVGYDRFGRVEQLRWRYTGGTAGDRDWFQYGFDPSGNRVWKQNLVAPITALQDESYAYDELSQLVSLQRGVIDVNRTAVRGVPAWQEEWSFDATGNWHQDGSPAPTGGGYRTRMNGTVTLDQNRVHNEANEITSLTTASGAGWVSPLTDTEGNLTRGPAETGSGTLYTYDAWGRLTNVAPYLGSSSSSALPSASYWGGGLP
jgi:YD repeat-containing protein